MQSRTRVIKEIVDKSLYVVDEHAVADAIVIRAMARAIIPEPARQPQRPPQVRSFRRDRGARSFRLCGSPPLRRQGQLV